MGGSGGGGNSGAVDFPEYMKSEHEVLLKEVKEAIHLAASDNPYSSMRQIDPSEIIQQNNSAIEAFKQALAEKGNWRINAVSATEVANEIYKNAQIMPDFDALEKAELERIRTRFKTEIIPEYRIGMRDAGVVMTSAYKIGEALMWLKMEQEHSGKGQEIYNKYIMALAASYPEYVRSLMAMPYQDIEQSKTAMHYTVETGRLAYAMMTEVMAQNNEYLVMDKTWPLELRKYFFDAMGCIQGAAGNATTAGKVSKASTAIGGAISGAATGAMMTGGNPIGAAVGGAVGLIGGLLS